MGNMHLGGLSPFHHFVPPRFLTSPACDLRSRSRRSIVKNVPILQRHLEDLRGLPKGAASEETLVYALRTFFTAPVNK